MTGEPALPRSRARVLRTAWWDSLGVFPGVLGLREGVSSCKERRAPTACYPASQTRGVAMVRGGAEGGGRSWRIQ